MNMNITINFDMDGTIADLYGVENWLDYLLNSDPFPYMNCKPMLHLSSLARMLNRLQSEGYSLCVISWLSKSGTDEYNNMVTEAKLGWLSKHLPSVNWDEINIVPYGTPKDNFRKSPLDILFDDEKPNRDNWGGRSYDVDNIMEILKNL